MAQKKADDHEKMSLEIEKKVRPISFFVESVQSLNMRAIQMLDLNNRMESEVSALSGDYDHLKSTLESYQMTLEKTMDRYMF